MSESFCRQLKPSNQTVLRESRSQQKQQQNRNTKRIKNPELFDLEQRYRQLEARYQDLFQTTKSRKHLYEQQQKEIQKYKLAQQYDLAQISRLRTMLHFIKCQKHDASTQTHMPEPNQQRSQSVLRTPKKKLRTSRKMQESRSRSRIEHEKTDYCGQKNSCSQLLGQSRKKSPLRTPVSKLAYGHHLEPNKFFQMQQSKLKKIGKFTQSPYAKYRFQSRLNL